MSEAQKILEISFSDSVEFKAPELPTEELAELHAIISAIQWERDNER